MNPASSLLEQLVSPEYHQSQLFTELIERIDRFCRFLNEIPTVISSGFDEAFHSQLKQIDQLSLGCHEAERDRLLRYCFQGCAAELDQSVMHERGRNKPMGYAGDYLSIDLTYQKYASPPERGRLWDLFYHRQDAPRAVCDRKERFCHLLKKVAAEINTRPIRILNIASGPCREILDGAAFAQLSPGEIVVDCVELDRRAIRYAQQLLGEEWSQSVIFHEGNALTMPFQGAYDLVWSAGLFDYLSDRRAASLLRRMWAATRLGGILVVGNFAETHQTRAYIEWCGAWFLHHRSEADLSTIATIAGILEERTQHALDSWSAIRYLIAKRQ